MLRSSVLPTLQWSPDAPRSSTHAPNARFAAPENRSCPTKFITRPIQLHPTWNDKNGDYPTSHAYRKSGRQCSRAVVGTAERLGLQYMIGMIVLVKSIRLSLLKRFIETHSTTSVTVAHNSGPVRLGSVRFDDQIHRHSLLNELG